jgi:hypothetical protein
VPLALDSLRHSLAHAHSLTLDSSFLHSALYRPFPSPASPDKPNRVSQCSSQRAGLPTLSHLDLLRFSLLFPSRLSADGVTFFSIPPFTSLNSRPMFTYAHRLVQQPTVAPSVYERTPSSTPSSASRSRTPSLHPSPISPLSIPTRPHQKLPPPIPALCPSPEPWVDALKDDIEAEFNLSLVDDIKTAKDAALTAATTAEERAAIQREYDESMADIRAQARIEFQRRVEAERERRLRGNFDGKDALIAEQHTIMESIIRDREASQSLATSAPRPQMSSQAPVQPHPHISRPSQPIPIPMQRSNSRNGAPWSSASSRTISSGNASSSSSSSSSRPIPRARRDSTQHPLSRPLPPPAASPATSVSSASSPSEPSSSHSSYSASGEHQVAAQKREEEIKRKEAIVRRHVEEARRREEAAARYEEDARQKNEEATRRMREAELYEHRVRGLEAGTPRTRTQSASVAPRLGRAFSKEAWQQHKQQ